MIFNVLFMTRRKISTDPAGIHQFLLPNCGQVNALPIEPRFELPNPLTNSMCPFIDHCIIIAVTQIASIY